MSREVTDLVYSDVYNPAHLRNPFFQPEIVQFDTHGNIIPCEADLRAKKAKGKAAGPKNSC